MGELIVWILMLLQYTQGWFCKQYGFFNARWKYRIVFSKNRLTKPFIKSNMKHLTQFLRSKCFFFCFLPNVETSNYTLSIYFLECENIFLLKNYITTTRYNIFAKPSGAWYVSTMIGFVFKNSKRRSLNSLSE